MATYKVLQDIESEDKLLGPLTLRQFLYAIVAVVCFYLSFLAATKGAPFLLPVFLLPGLIGTFFAFPWGRDQPTEVWALAKIRFLIKPRRRIWDQSGMKELVTITAPKKIERIYTNGLSEDEVNSRLQALADTIDSRGWAIKNVNVNLYSQPNLLATESGSDRLIDISSIPTPVPTIDVQASDDIMDEKSNPIAQQFDQMINEEAAKYRQKLITEMNRSDQSDPDPAQVEQAPPDYWFLKQSGSSESDRQDDGAISSPAVVTPGSQTADQTVVETEEEKALVEKIKKQKGSQNISYAHLKILNPEDAHRPTAPAATLEAAPPVTQVPDPAKIDLARRNDLSVATIQHMASKEDESPDNEVVISLH